LEIYIEPFKTTAKYGYATNIKGFFEVDENGSG
jgi:hypothetical protein